MLLDTLNQINSYFKTDSEIIDELGVIDHEIKLLESRAREIKAKLIERGAGNYQGSRYRAEVQMYDRNNISAILVKEFGTKEFVQQVTQVQHVKAVTVKPLEDKQ
jgi:hypothetical protein